MIINATNIIVAFLISFFRYGESLNIVLVCGAVSIGISMVIVIFSGKETKASSQ